MQVPMFRFTIRDVLWLMVVVAVALAMWRAWQVDHFKQEKKFEFYHKRYWEGNMRDIRRSMEQREPATPVE
jgi:hypothetical protein